jgi:hypothetical protein
MNNIKTSATKVFSQVAADREWLTCLRGSSVSDIDANLRRGVYQKVFSRFDDMRNQLKAFSGVAETPLLSNQYFNATMASYVRSVAGFLSIERDMDQPTALLWFMDLIGVLDNRVVLPNVGMDNLSGIAANISDTGALVSSTINYSAGEKLVPGSVQLKLIHAASPNNPVVIKDDYKGNLIAPANILDIGTVSYLTGAIEFKVGSGFTPAANDTYYLSATKDVAGAPNDGVTIPAAGFSNRFKLDMNHITVTAMPDMLIAEKNLISIASMQRAIGVNPSDIAAAKITELYTKLINFKLAEAIIGIDQSTSHDIDTAQWTADFYDYSSRLDAFRAALIDVDAKLAGQSAKGVAATAYLVGTNVAGWFRKLTQDNLFVDNTDCSYINDLIGYYKGIPVVRHTSVNTNTGYAIHKTADGQLAPLMRGIFLPLTDTPQVGNYNNPTQLASGVYYQEANEGIVPELIQKFTVNS